MSGFIPLSVPNFGEKEAAYAAEAITSGWVSTSGAKVSEFEEALAAYVGMPRAVAANSGTSSLHLAAMAAGIRRGDEVIVPTLTFIAAVNPLTRYVGAEPIFIGCNDTLCIDPDAVEDFCANHCTLKEDGLYNNKTGARVRALGVVHVFGNMADMPRLLDIARRYKLILIEDATEALGTRYTAGPLAGKAAGTMGDIGCYSFNGNKIMTTGAGGFVVSNHADWAEHAKHLSTQAKADMLQFLHDEVGYNYRMSNVVAGVVRGQYPHLEEHIAQKKAIYQRYRDGLRDLPVTMNPIVDGTEPNYWLSALVIDEDAMCAQLRDDSRALYYPKAGKSCPTEILGVLAKYNAEGRPIWKPMHMQPMYRMHECVGREGSLRCRTNAYIAGGVPDVGADIFARGLCLPSDNKMTPERQDTVIELIRACFA